MTNNMDWAAATNSEIFREYVKQELAKEPKKEAQIDEGKLFDNFDQFEKEVRSSTKKMASFRALQNKFINDPDYADQCQPDFVSAVMMLNLDE